MTRIDDHTYLITFRMEDSGRCVLASHCGRVNGTMVYSIEVFVNQSLHPGAAVSAIPLLPVAQYISSLHAVPTLLQLFRCAGYSAHGVAFKIHCTRVEERVPTMIPDHHHSVNQICKDTEIIREERGRELYIVLISLMISKIIS